MTLLNLTHHPSAGWAEHQRNAASRLFPTGTSITITDYPFPQVDAQATTEAVDQLADDLANDISLRYAPNATVVHLMGEMTLVVALVARLQGLGYRVVASTTERVVQQLSISERKLLFNFVAFREYAPLYTAV